MDSPKSPSGDSNETSTPNANPSQIVITVYCPVAPAIRRSNIATPAPPNVPRTTPPTKPAQVLEGLASGDNFCRPQARPAKYAPVSASQVEDSASAVHHNPSPC